MKSHATNILRSTSKARAWYGFALLFGVGIFLFPTFAQAALTSPVPVVSGSGYGLIDSLGLRQENIIGEDGLAFAFGQSWHRRIVYMEPPGGKKLLVAAVVNKSSTINGCSGSTPKCRLEFRVSENNGLTWSQALLGPKPYLEITGPKFDYSIYPDPNGNDLWVSYTDSVVSSSYTFEGVAGNQNFTNSTIQRLALDTTTKLAWTLSDSERPNLSLSSTDGTFKDYVSPTAVGIQVDGNYSRVWAAVSYVYTNTNPSVITRDAVLVYKDTSKFGKDNSDWTGSKQYSRNMLQYTGQTGPGYTKGANEFGASAKIAFIPLGTKKLPLAVMSTARRNVGCITLDNPTTNMRGLLLLVLSNSNGSFSDWEPFVVSPSYPFYYLSIVNGSTCLSPTDAVENLMVPSSGLGYRFDFSAAALPDPHNPSKGRVVLAYEGGVESNGTTREGDIRVATCDVLIDGTITGDITCPIVDKYITGSNGSPSVGFYEGVPWVAYSQHVNTTPSYLHFTKETNYSPSTGTWTWAEQAGVNYTKDAIMPSVPAYIPSGAMPMNSQYIPTLWSEKQGNRIAFSANAGGTTIGTNPKVTANPIWGYGWASNFGWLSLNCINKPDQNCTTSLFGLGIGSLAAVSTTDLPPVTGLSPTSASTFPIGGYAWSSNAGFLSLERGDSICPTANCTSPAVANPNGNPPGLAYNNYSPGGTPSANVPLAKYDTTSQRVYGWGRFLNLCNYDYTSKRCLDKDNGWVRLRGYYTAGSSLISINATDSTHFTIADTPCSVVLNRILSADGAYVRVNSCSGDFSGVLDTQTPFPYSSGSHDVYDVTGKEYGLDAFWTGDHYELAGWAWSNDYGWVRFNPLIFIGFSWLETLFGNVYSGGDITLPNAENLSHKRFTTCGTGGNEPCYVSTYRIEAGGSISSLTYSGTGDSPYPADSAAGSILKSGVDPTRYTCDSAAEPSKERDPLYCVLQGNTTVLNPLLEREWGNPSNPPYSFPTVGSTTTSYRNALGKLDVGGLTTIIGKATEYTDVISTPNRSFMTKSNRFGNTVYKTSLTNPVPTWTINELSGWANQNWGSSQRPEFPLNVTTTVPTTGPIAPLRSQVVHVQGNLNVDGAEAISNVLTLGGTNTLTVTSSSGAFPSNLINIPSTSFKASCAGCAIVLDPGGLNEEYFSYTGYVGAGSTGTFTGVQKIKSGTTFVHPAGQQVRWVWRLPYVDNGTTNIAQRTTIVVDGDLNIQYNIIAADRSKDADLSTTAAANTIRDLPTIAFVVKGNVIIDPQVNKLTGAFIVTSRNTTPDPDSVVSGTIVPNSDSACTSQYSGCGGLFKTGNDNVSTICNAATKVCRPLTITGLLFARLFAFERIGSLQKNDTPGERVIADERLFLNPPPGLEDVTKALPNPTRTLP